MEDVVAVEVVTTIGGPYYFVTFGRVQDLVDPTELEAIVLAHATGFAIRGEATAARVCGSLQEAREAPYFFEALIDFGAALATARSDPDVDRWRAATDAEMRAGRHLYYLGDPEALWFKRA